MEKTESVYRTYVSILERELVCAMGCTEPVALAFCAAKARSVLGAVPERILVEASGNIIKNVKSVIVPNTVGRRGIAAQSRLACWAGTKNPGWKSFPVCRRT